MSTRIRILPESTRSYKLSGRAYPTEYLDMVYGDKNIYSTPEDMLKWDAALRGGVMFKAVYPGQRVYSL